MLFTSEYEHTIDSKQRLAIPAEIRSRLDPERDGGAFYLTQGPNGFLWLWPEKAFERMSSLMGESLLPAEEMMEFDEATFPLATHLPLDSAGRIRIPERMLRRGGLGSSVMILGMRDHLELRDPEQWRRQVEEQQTRHREIMLKARQVMMRRQAGNDHPGP